MGAPVTDPWAHILNAIRRTLVPPDAAPGAVLLLRVEADAVCAALAHFAKRRQAHPLYRALGEAHGIMVRAIEGTKQGDVT